MGDAGAGLGDVKVGRRGGGRLVTAEQHEVHRTGSVFSNLIGEACMAASYGLAGLPYPAYTGRLSCSRRRND